MVKRCTPENRDTYERDVIWSGWVAGFRFMAWCATIGAVVIVMVIE